MSSFPVIAILDVNCVRCFSICLIFFGNILNQVNTSVLGLKLFN